MIELSDEQQKAVLSQPGLPLRVVAPTTGQAFVLLPAEEYERLTSAAYDASPWSDDEMDVLAAEDADRLGWQGMESYQDRNP
jgi:hypothetical protein